jgi:Sec-independent protein translocase protein TatA
VVVVVPCVLRLEQSPFEVLVVLAVVLVLETMELLISILHPQLLLMVLVVVLVVGPTAHPTIVQQQQVLAV